MTEQNPIERYLQVTVGERIVCVPVSNIGEIVNPEQDRRLTDQIVSGKGQLVVGDREMPMVDLRRVFDEPATLSGDTCRILLTRHGDQELALLVDSTERILCPEISQIESFGASDDEHGREPISANIVWEDQRYPVISVADVFTLVRAGR